MGLGRRDIGRNGGRRVGGGWLEGIDCWWFGIEVFLGVILYGFFRVLGLFGACDWKFEWVWRKIL